MFVELYAEHYDVLGARRTRSCEGSEVEGGLQGDWHQKGAEGYTHSTLAIEPCK